MAGSSLGQLPISLFARYPFTNYLQNCQQQQGHAQSETTANKRQANKQWQNGKTKRDETSKGKQKKENELVQEQEKQPKGTRHKGVGINCRRINIIIIIM